MKRIAMKLLPTLLISLLWFGFGCTKEQVDPQATGAMNLTKAQGNGQQQYLIQRINDPNIDVYDLGKELLDRAPLKPSVCNALLNRAAQLDDFVEEAVYLASSPLSESLLLNMVASPDIDNDLLEDVLLANAPLPSSVKNATQSQRPSIDLVSIQAVAHQEKLFCLATQEIVTADVIVEHYNCNNGKDQILMLNPSSRACSKTITDQNLLKLASGCGRNWACGELLVIDDDDEDGSWTLVRCTLPPEVKCARKIRSADQPIPQNQRNLARQIRNGTGTDVNIAKRILNRQNPSTRLLRLYLDHGCNRDPATIEAALIGSSPLDTDLLLRAVAATQLSDGAIENLLIVNPMLSEQQLLVVKKMRPNIDISAILATQHQTVFYCIADQAILMGDNATIQHFGPLTEIQVTAASSRALADQLSPFELDVILAGGGGKWIKGDFVGDITSSNGDVTFQCQRPPNPKCIKLAR